jgi:hypothetical protein
MTGFLSPQKKAPALISVVERCNLVFAGRAFRNDKGNPHRQDSVPGRPEVRGVAVPSKIFTFSAR